MLQLQRECGHSHPEGKWLPTEQELKRELGILTPRLVFLDLLMPKAIKPHHLCHWPSLSPRISVEPLV